MQVPFRVLEINGDKAVLRARPTNLIVPPVWLNVPPVIEVPPTIFHIESEVDAVVEVPLSDKMYSPFLADVPLAAVSSEITDTNIPL